MFNIITVTVITINVGPGKGRLLSAPECCRGGGRILYYTVVYYTILYYAILHYNVI